MSTATNETKTAQTTTTQVIGQASTAITNADSTAAQAVQGLTLVHQARVAQLTRTAASVSARYGASSPQAKAAKAAVMVSQATLSRVALLQKRVSLPTPEAPAHGWVLYGHVYHSTLKPAAAYTVFFVDEQNAYQANIGFAYTGKDGSFDLSYTGDRNASAAAIFLEIVNDKAQPVYLSSTAFQPQIGAANYQDITLPAGEPVLGDPPPTIRAIAMPDSAASSASSQSSKSKSTKSQRSKSQKGKKLAAEELSVDEKITVRRVEREKEE